MSVYDEFNFLTLNDIQTLERNFVSMMIHIDEYIKSLPPCNFKRGYIFNHYLSIYAKTINDEKRLNVISRYFQPNLTLKKSKKTRGRLKEIKLVSSLILHT